MPFTFSHPAAILPLHRWFKQVNGIGSALVIGSISPDLPYFFKFLPTPELTHSLFGIITTCLPMSLLLWMLWMLLLKPALADGLPHRLASQCHKLSQTPPPKPTTRFCAELTLALCIGALTHVVWDSFTHRQGYVVQHFPIFESQIFAFNGYTLTVYRLLQHVSSITGLLILAVYAIRHYQRSSDAQSWYPRYPWALFACLFVSFALGLLSVLHSFGQILVEKSLFILATVSIHWWIICMLLYALFWRVAHSTLPSK